MTARQPNRNEQNTADQRLADGLSRHAQIPASFTLASVSIATADIVAALKRRIACARVVDSTRARWREAVRAQRDGWQKSEPTIAAVKELLHLMFAGSADTLAEFGLAPRKVRVVSPETLVAGAAKARATRKARHTMGARQKKAVKGDVTAVVMTPIKSAAGSGATPPPAPPAGAPQVATPAPKTAS